LTWFRENIELDHLPAELPFLRTKVNSCVFSHIVRDLSSQRTAEKACFMQACLSCRGGRARQHCAVCLRFGQDRSSRKRAVRAVAAGIRRDMVTSGQPATSCRPCTGQRVPMATRLMLSSVDELFVLYMLKDAVSLAYGAPQDSLSGVQHAHIAWRPTRKLPGALCRPCTWSVTMAPPGRSSRWQACAAHGAAPQLRTRQANSQHPNQAPHSAGWLQAHSPQGNWYKGRGWHLPGAPPTEARGQPPQGETRLWPRACRRGSFCMRLPTAC
jgi:hypothetical protein